MKRILILLGILFGSAPVFAFLPVQTYQEAISSITTQVVTISTSPVTGATQVDAIELEGRVSMEIQNIDTVANLWCVPTSSAALTSNSGTGRKIAPGNSWILSIADLLQPPGGYVAGTTVGVETGFWCISDGVAATKAVVTQLY
jgi:hypothetical protein